MILASLITNRFCYDVFCRMSSPLCSQVAPHLERLRDCDVGRDPNSNAELFLTVIEIRTRVYPNVS